MTIYRGRPFSPVEAQADLMKSHVTRGAAPVMKTDGERTMRLAMPQSWTKEAKCLGSSGWDETHGMKAGNAAALCAGCPVIEQCLAAAMTEERGLSAGNRYTVRGGKSPKERALLEFAARTCERGHRDRWSDQPGANGPRCLECIAEDARVRYAEKKQDKTFKQRRNERHRARRAFARVSCLACKAEMSAGWTFLRHLNNVHGEERAA